MSTDLAKAKAQALWDWFLERYGADSLKSKYGVKPPGAWVTLCGELKDWQITRGQRRCRETGGAHLPSLFTFEKWARHDDDERVSNPVPPPPPLDTSPENMWRLRGVGHMGCYMARRACHQISYTDEQREPLQQARDGWIEDMIDLERADQVPADKGKAEFAVRMKQAEAAIEWIRANPVAA